MHPRVGVVGDRDPAAREHGRGGAAAAGELAGLLLRAPVVRRPPVAPAACPTSPAVIWYSAVSVTTYTPCSSTASELKTPSPRSVTWTVAGRGIDGADPSVLGDEPDQARPVRHQRDQAVVVRAASAETSNARSCFSCAVRSASEVANSRMRPSVVATTARSCGVEVEVGAGAEVLPRRRLPSTSGRSGSSPRRERVHVAVEHVQGRTARSPHSATSAVVAVEGEGGALLEAVPGRVDLRVAPERTRVRRRRRSPSRRRASSCGRWRRARDAAARPSRPRAAVAALPVNDGVTSAPGPGGIGRRPSGTTTTTAVDQRCHHDERTGGPPGMTRPGGPSYGRDEQGEHPDAPAPTVRGRTTAPRPAPTPGLATRREPRGPASDRIVQNEMPARPVPSGRRSGLSGTFRRGTAAARRGR